MQPIVTHRLYRAPFERIRHCLVLTMVVLLAGCTSHGEALRTGAGDEKPRVFQVVRHGWHVGIVVGRDDLTARVPRLGEDFREADHLEIGWGDARFYQADDPSAGLFLRAALWPTDSVLHVVGFSGAPARVFPGSEVVHICLAPSAYGRLLDFIAHTFERQAAGKIIPLGPGLYGTSRFYRARGAFHVFNTCNTWAARAIAASGLPVSHRLTLTAGGVISQLRRNGQEVFPCP